MPSRCVARCAALLLPLFALPACSHTAALQADATPVVGADPGYQSLVGAYLQKTFKTLSPSTGFEISSPRWMQSNKGWSWLACVRFQDRGQRRTYAVFFNEAEVVDGRYAVQTDDCGSQTYAPFDLDIGATRPGAVGDTGPLY